MLFPRCNSLELLTSNLVTFESQSLEEFQCVLLSDLFVNVQLNIRNDAVWFCQLCGSKSLPPSLPRFLSHTGYFVCGGVSLTFLIAWLNQSHCLSCCLCGIVSSDCDADLCEPESPFVSGRYQIINGRKKK